jgi:thermitase
MRSKGGVVVTSAGNTGGLLSDPPRDSLTVVAATDTNDERLSFSSYGDFVDMAAPGIGILTTKMGGGYGSLSGTSAASPIVAGVYALMMSADSSLQPASLDNTLFSTALDLGDSGFDPYYGYGRVQAADAVAAIGQAPPPSDTESPSVAITSPTGGDVSGLVPVDVNATDNVAVARVELYVDNSLLATDSFAPYGFTLDSSQYAGTVNLQARAYDAADNSASSNIVLVTVASNTTTSDITPPQVVIQNPADGSRVSGTVTISASATDNDGISMITLSIDGHEVNVWNNSSSVTYQWTTKPPRGRGKKSDPYSSTISVTAEDTSGNTATAAATVTVTR